MRRPDRVTRGTNPHGSRLQECLVWPKPERNLSRKGYVPGAGSPTPALFMVFHLSPDGMDYIFIRSNILTEFGNGARRVVSEGSSHQYGGRLPC